MSDGAALRTVGIEQELLLARPSDWTLAPRSSIVIDDPASAEEFQHEFKREMIEIATQPCSTLEELSRDLHARRDHLTSVAADHDLVACASATSPYVGRAHTFDDRRYDRMIEELTVVGTSQLCCGMHVHVAVESREEGLGVLDRIRPWLAVLVALSANSPFWQGQDSGYASYRSVVLAALPTCGPAPIWHDLASYDACERDLIATGAALDEGMLYFDARLSPRYPTVEIRVMDVTQRVDEAVMMAGLCRALVDAAATAWRAGEAPLDLPTPVLRAAAWRASRFGMSEHLFDPATRAQVPAWQLVDALVERHREQLAANGDLDLVQHELGRLRAEGTGAERLRTVRDTGGTLESVMAATEISQLARSE